jgi:Tryptophan-associated transmembrane protein (Trp_oprn_chp)
MTERPHRRSLGPVVLVGLASATLVAVAGNRTWAVADSGAARDVSSLALSVDAGKMPAATALALVLLACWGVVLVTRGRVRRAVAALGVLAALGTVLSVVLGWTSVVDALRNDLASVGVTDVEIGHTGWFWAAAVGAVLALASSVAAVVLVPGWPEMGSRYDAPGAAPPPAPAPEDQSSLDLWRAMDEGRDPTAGPAE